MAHIRPRKRNCQGWDLLTDQQKDPDSNRITKEEYERALAANKVEKVHGHSLMTFQPSSGLAPKPSFPIACRGSKRRRMRPGPAHRRRQLHQGHRAFASRTS